MSANVQMLTKNPKKVQKSLQRMKVKQKQSHVQATLFYYYPMPSEVACQKDSNAEE